MNICFHKQPLDLEATEADNGGSGERTWGCTRGPLLAGQEDYSGSDFQTGMGAPAHTPCPGLPSGTAPHRQRQTVSDKSSVDTSLLDPRVAQQFYVVTTNITTHVLTALHFFSSGARVVCSCCTNVHWSLCLIILQSTQKMSVSRDIWNIARISVLHRSSKTSFNYQNVNPNGFLSGFRTLDNEMCAYLPRTERGKNTKLTFLRDLRIP